MLQSPTSHCWIFYLSAHLSVQAGDQWLQRKWSFCHRKSWHRSNILQHYPTPSWSLAVISSLPFNSLYLSFCIVFLQALSAINEIATNPAVDRLLQLAERISRAAEHLPYLAITQITLLILYSYPSFLAIRLVFSPSEISQHPVLLSLFPQDLKLLAVFPSLLLYPH